MSNETNSPTGDSKKTGEEIKIVETEEDLSGMFDCMFFTADPNKVNVHGNELKEIKVEEPEDFSEIHIKGESKPSTVRKGKEDGNGKNKKTKKDVSSEKETKEAEEKEK